MIKVTAPHKGLVVDILSASFDSNKSVNYVAKQDKKRLKRIRVLMEYSFDTCLAFGDVFISDDKKACALLLYPEKKKTTFKSIINDLRLALFCIGIARVIKVLERESAIKSNHQKALMTYLWFMGVTPSMQGKGIGGSLLQEIIQYSNQQQRSIYLETSTLKNLPWYQKYGFEIIRELDLTYVLFILKRN